MSDRRTQADANPCIPIFGAALPNLMIESVVDPDHSNQLLLHTWDGRKDPTMATISYRSSKYIPASISGGLANAVRFPRTSKAFESAGKLTASTQEFLSRYVCLAPDETALLIAFAFASYFVDCLPVAPVLILFGPDDEAGLVLRLLGCLCRRPVLLGDIDIAALATLPSQLDATLLINQRNLSPRVMRILLASNNRHFCIARGKGHLNCFGAKAFSADPEFGNRIGLHLSLSPAPDALLRLTDTAEKEIASDFQAKLLRYRMVNYGRVRDAKIEFGNFVSGMRDEVHAWLAPLADCPDLCESVTNSLLQKNRDFEGNRISSDDRCLVAEAALFFCHKKNSDHFFVGELAECVNVLLKGRHEDRVLTDKKVGLLLSAIGVRGERVVRGYKIVLTESVRQQIHGIARAYQVLSVQDRVRRCEHCSDIAIKKAVSPERMNVCTSDSKIRHRGT